MRQHLTRRCPQPRTDLSLLGDRLFSSASSQEDRPASSIARSPAWPTRRCILVGQEPGGRVSFLIVEAAPLIGLDEASIFKIRQGPQSTVFRAVQKRAEGSARRVHMAIVEAVEVPLEKQQCRFRSRSSDRKATKSITGVPQQNEWLLLVFAHWPEASCEPDDLFPYPCHATPRHRHHCASGLSDVDRLRFAASHESRSATR